MRYLVTVIAVLALASPAMSICNPTVVGSPLHADSDNDLNKYGGEYDTPDCKNCNWAWDFDRNDNTSGSETMTLRIAGTDFEVVYPSQFTPEGDYSDSGTAKVSSSPNELQMLISPDTEQVYFQDINLSVSYYR